MTKRTSYANPQGVITLKTEIWEYNCGDSCCYDYGIDLYCNGVDLNINLQHTSLEYIIEAVVEEVGLVSDNGIKTNVQFFSDFYEFKTKGAMEELLVNFSKLEEMEDYNTLWDYFNPDVEFFFLDLLCKELVKEKTTEQNDKFAVSVNEQYLQELIIVNGHTLPVVGSVDDDEFEIFDKLVKVLEILGFKVRVEND